jgi:hypothetical protein
MACSCKIRYRYIGYDVQDTLTGPFLYADGQKGLLQDVWNGQDQKDRYPC